MCLVCVWCIFEREPWGLCLPSKSSSDVEPAAFSVACKDPLLPRFLLLRPLPPSLHLSLLGVILQGLKAEPLTATEKQAAWTFLSSPVLLGHSFCAPAVYFGLLTASHLDFTGRLSCGGLYYSNNTREGVLCCDYGYTDDSVDKRWVLLIFPK